MAYALTKDVQSWGSMLGAAERRFDEADQLFRSGPQHYAGCVYLCGYVVELTLKSAYFQVDGTFSSTDDVELLCKRPDGIMGWHPQNHHLLGYSERGHDLLAWWYVLNFARSYKSLARLPIEASNHVAIVAAVWGTFRRYDSRPAFVQDADPIHKSTAWLFNNKAVLWS